MPDNQKGFVPPPPPTMPTYAQANFMPQAQQAYTQNLPQGPGLPQTPYTPPPMPAPYENAPENPETTETKKALSNILKQDPQANFLPAGVQIPQPLVPVEMARQQQLEESRGILKGHMQITNLLNSLRDDPQGTAAQAAGRALGNYYSDRPGQFTGGSAMSRALNNAKAARAFAKGQFDDRRQQAHDKYEVTKIMTDMNKTLSGDQKEAQEWAKTWDAHVDNINKNTLNAVGKIMDNQRNRGAERTAQLNAQTAQTQAGSGIVNAGTAQQDALIAAQNAQTLAATQAETARQNKIHNAYEKSQLDFEKEKSRIEVQMAAGTASIAAQNRYQDIVDKQRESQMAYLKWGYEQSQKGQQAASTVDKPAGNMADPTFKYQTPVTTKEGETKPSGQPMQPSAPPTYAAMQQQIPAAQPYAPSPQLQAMQQAAQQYAGQPQQMAQGGPPGPMGGQQQPQQMAQGGPQQQPQGAAPTQGAQPTQGVSPQVLQKSVATISREIYQKSGGRLTPDQAHEQAVQQLASQGQNRSQ